MVHKLLLLALLSGWPCWSAPAADLGMGRVNLVQGRVQIQTPETGEWSYATVNTPLEAEDRFYCPDDSRLELQFSDGTVVRLDHSSSLDILQLSPDIMQFRLGQGRLYLRTGNGPGPELQVDVTDTVVAVHGPSRFRLDQAANGSEEISIYEGELTVAARGAHTTVRTGESLTLENGSAEVSGLNPRDAWLRWNEARDREQTAAESSTYLPPELAAYAYDLNVNGEWIALPDYGHVWAPRVGPGWAPYHIGHWVWMGNDYVWLSDETWGWVPFHYGRWVFAADRWCWVPPAPGDVYWGPGYVGWIYTPDYVGWVPLAPGEIYFGYGYFGRHCVNLDQTHLRREEIREPYRNVKGRDGLALVAHDTFRSGKTVLVFPSPEIMRKLESPGAYSLGRPNIHPAPTARLFGQPVSPNRVPGPKISSPAVREVRPYHPLLQPMPVHPGRQGFIPPASPRPYVPKAVPNVGHPQPSRGLGPSFNRVWHVHPRAESHGSQGGGTHGGGPHGKGHSSFPNYGVYRYAGLSGEPPVHLTQPPGLIDSPPAYIRRLNTSEDAANGSFLPHANRNDNDLPESYNRAESVAFDPRYAPEGASIEMNGSVGPVQYDGYGGGDGYDCYGGCWPYGWLGGICGYFGDGYGGGYYCFSGPGFGWYGYGYYGRHGYGYYGRHGYGYYGRHGYGYYGRHGYGYYGRHGYGYYGRHGYGYYGRHGYGYYGRHGYGYYGRHGYGYYGRHGFGHGFGYGHGYGGHGYGGHGYGGHGYGGHGGGGHGR